MESSLTDLTHALQVTTLEHKHNSDCGNEDATPTKSAPDAVKEEKARTLYPSTNGKVKELKYHLDRLKMQDTIDLIGTVKLHGAHTDIVVYSDNSIKFQSRNMHDLTPTRDVNGFAEAFSPFKLQIEALRNKVLQRWQAINYGALWGENNELIIAGEYVGPGIQKGVAINQLPKKMFVIFGLCLNGTWLPTEPYSDIESTDIDIYHVCRGGFYRHTLPLWDIAGSLESIQHLADSVEQACPIGKSFGLQGKGEGTVWKPVAPELASRVELWYKMRGQSSTGQMPPRVRLDQSAVQDKKTFASEFARSVVFEKRLEQGLEYMAELGLPRDKNGVNKFMKWMKGDVEKEEAGEIAEAKADMKIVLAEVGKLAAKWYLARLKHEQ